MPKDHAKENLRKLRELAASRRSTLVAEASALTEKREPFKLKRFTNHASSVVASMVRRSARPCTCDATNR